MFIPFLMFHSSHDHMAKRSHYHIMIFSTSEYYTDASPPSFSSISSTVPPPLYSLSMSTDDGPTWRRIPPGCEVWLSGRSQLYLGGLASLQTRHCQGRMGLSSDSIFACIFCPFLTQLYFTFLTPPFSPYAFHAHEQMTRTQFDWYYRTPNNSSTGLLTSRNSPVVVPLHLDPVLEPLLPPLNAPTTQSSGLPGHGVRAGVCLSHERSW